jgi:arginine-tRNA-protein transferase
MKISCQEFGQLYKEYKFAYCLYAEREPNEKLSHVYDAGFLPYSADVARKNVFYMARSCRVNLHDFSLSSENRRVWNMFEGKLERKKLPIQELINDHDFLTFCHDYFLQKHGPGIFSHDRVRHVISYFEAHETIVYGYYDKKDQSLVGYVLEIRDGIMAHYWFSFYSLEHSVGMWLIIDCLLQAQKDGLAYYYLGTVYGTKALYKTNIEQIEYWNGSSWISDRKGLREKMRQDV